MIVKLVKRNQCVCYAIVNNHTKHDEAVINM